MARVSVHYTAFGEMAVSVGGARQPLTRRRERGVLSVLLAAHGAPVAAERLLAEVWGDDAPGQTLGSLQVAVSRLRTQLEPERAARKGSRLVSTAAGYSLVAEVDDVDVWRFEALAESALAATTPEARLAASEEALALWTSTPYADCDSPLVLSETSRLEELRLTVEEQRARALIDLGRPDDAQRALASAGAAAPLPRAAVVAARARAVPVRAAGRRTRHPAPAARGLAEELGVDPSEEIQRLEQAVLRQDPSLTAPVPAPDARTHPDPASRCHRAAPRAPTGTVGRQPVFDQAVALLEEASSTGSMRFLLVAGEPGIGKSRLVTDLGDRASAAGFRVLVGRCHEGDYAPALWPWLGIVRSARRASPDSSADPRLDPLLGGELTGEASGGGTGLRMFDAVVELVQRSADETPLLLVLEDLHWADATSLRLLSHLAGSGLRAPVVVTCTRRTTEATTGPALVDTMAALARAGAERIRLDGLDTGAVGELLQGSVGEHDARLDAVVADRTGGNPFFVLQYARLLAATPDLRTVAADRPPGARRHPRRPAAARRPAAGGGGDGADRGRRTRSPDRPGPGLGARRAPGRPLPRPAGPRDDQRAGRGAGRGLRLRARARARDDVRRAQRRSPDAAARPRGTGDRAASCRQRRRERRDRAPRPPRCAARSRARRARVRLARPRGEGRGRPARARRGARPVAVGPCRRATGLGRPPHSPDAARGRRCCGSPRPPRRASRSRVRSGWPATWSAGTWWPREPRSSTEPGSGPGASTGGMDEAFIAILTEAAEHLDGAERATVLATLQVEHFYGWDSSVGDAIGRESVEVARRSGDTAVLIEVLLMRVLAAVRTGARRGAARTCSTSSRRTTCRGSSRSSSCSSAGTRSTSAVAPTRPTT